MYESPAHRSRESQEDLRTRILTNPEEGWKEFLADYGPMIRKLVRTFGLSREDQEEVFQEVSHNLVKNDHKAIQDWLHEKSSLANYVAVITVRTTITFTRSAFYRHSKEVLQIGSGEGLVSSLDSLCESPTRSARERLHRIHMAQTLNGTLHRMVEEKTIRQDDYLLIALRMNGLHYKEIQEILGIPVETLTSRVTRLKPILVKALQQLDITPADISQD